MVAHGASYFGGPLHVAMARVDSALVGLGSLAGTVAPSLRVAALGPRGNAGKFIPRSIIIIIT